MPISMTPIAFVRNERTAISDDNWGDVRSTITLADDVPTEALAGIGVFSHLYIIYHFNQVPEEKAVFGSRHPRGNTNWPIMGTLAQRHKNRPNRIGLSIAELLEVKEREIIVRGLDAIDGTPVLDIKPVFNGFLPKGEVKEPAWVKQLMQNYW